jgi:NADH dehydrogenase
MTMAGHDAAGSSSTPRVVIIGGGFAGLFAVRALRRSNVAVTLVDRSEHHLFQPLLYQCATGILSEGQIALPLRSLLRRHRHVSFTLAEVADFDVDNHQVICRRPGGTTIRLGYDHLIVAAGVRQSYFGHDEFAAYAPGMKTMTDALAIRQRVFGAFEIADSAADPEERRRWLTFALVGAGPTGSPARSVSSPRPHCARSTTTSTLTRPGYCSSTAAASRSRRSVPSSRPRPKKRCDDSAWSCR